tara:strand:- start:114 stop:242 length:129 start_codon:yes stop_codon:yes gene_type:complete
MIAFVLDKFVDARFEKTAEQTYISLLTRNSNEEFHDLLALLV